MKGVISLRAIYLYLKDLQDVEAGLKEEGYPREGYETNLRTSDSDGTIKSYYYPEYVKEEDKERWAEKYEYWIEVCREIEMLEENLGKLIKLNTIERKKKKNLWDEAEIEELLVDMDEYVLSMLESSKLNIVVKKKDSDISNDGIICKIKEYMRGQILRINN
jgi:hypothetical protein